MMHLLLLIFLIFQTGCSAKPIVNQGEKSCVPTKIQSKYDLWQNGVCLRGANIWQKKTNPAIDGNSLGNEKIGPPFLQADFDDLSKLGANWINLSVPGIFSENSPYVLDKEALLNLDVLVERALKANLFVVISFRTGPGRDENAIINSTKGLHDVWKLEEAQKGWVEMWQATAEHYKNAKNVVAYNLMVEPNSNVALYSMGDPKQFYPLHANSLSDWNPLLERLVLSIRNIDSETPVIIESMNYADLAWLPQIANPKSKNLVYAVHHYKPYQFTHQRPPLRLKYGGKADWSGTGKREVLNKKWLESKLSGVATFKNKTSAPVTVNEWGVMRFEPGATSYFKDGLEVLETVGVNHATWLWESSYSGIHYDEFNFRNGTAYSNHNEKLPNSLSETLQANWKKNLARPSNVTFLP